MRVLTKQEEIHVLRMLDHKDRIGCGSSRYVMSVPTEMARYLGLDLTKHYVVKLAIGLGGLNQHQHEVEMWQDTQDNSFLAEIFATGHFLSIMEEVSCDEEENLAEAIYANMSDEELEEAIYETIYDDLLEDGGYDRYFKIATSIRSLAYYNGCTADNGQLGLTLDGRWVAYDYGFISDGNLDQCSDELGENLYEPDCFYYYINKLVCLLEDMVEVDNKLELLSKRMITVEHHINEAQWAC